MDKQREWPIWFRITFEEFPGGGIKGYRASAHNANMFKDRLIDSGIKESQVMHFVIEGQGKLSPEQVTATFKTLEKRKKEREEIEKRKKAEEEAKEPSKRSRTKSR